MFAHPEPVTILTAGTEEDPYSGEASESWEVALGASERVDHCGVAPGGSTEVVAVNRTPVDSDFDLIFDHDPAIVPTNRVIVRGLTCNVVGRPMKWRSPFTGWEPGWIVQAKIREG